MAGAHEPKGMSRRGFLKATAAVAAPLILPNTSFGANERVTMGLLGSGGQGVHDMRGFLGCPGLQVVAVCDVQEGRRNAARTLVNNHYAGRAEKDYKGCEAYNDFREVLARDDVDAVLIAPQDHWHAIMAVQAAEAGKDMYCEKPLGVSVRECQAIRDTVRRLGRVFQTGTQQRSDRRFRQACELARNGYLGKLHTVKVGAPGPSYQPRYRGPEPVSLATPSPSTADPAAWFLASWCADDLSSEYSLSSSPARLGNSLSPPPPPTACGWLRGTIVPVTLEIPRAP